MLKSLATLALLFSDSEFCSRRTDNNIQCYDLILHRDSQVTEIGSISNKKYTYQVARFEIIYGQSKKSTRRLLIFKNKFFLGYYEMGENNYCKIKYKILTCDSNENLGNKIHFGKNGPPKRILFGGDMVYLRSDRPHIM